MGWRSEPILLSQFSLIMHLSSLLCYSSAFILYPSYPVCGKWARGHTLLSALGVPHCFSSSMFCQAPVSPSLFLHQSVFMFLNCAGKCSWRCFVSTGAVTVGIVWEKWHFISWESVYAVQSHRFTPHCSSLIIAKWWQIMWHGHICLFYFFHCFSWTSSMSQFSICTEMHSKACGLVSVTHKSRNIFMTENLFRKSFLSSLISSCVWWTNQHGKAWCQAAACILVESAP